jgi:hypothetical protein
MGKIQIPTRSSTSNSANIRRCDNSLKKRCKSWKRLQRPTKQAGLRELGGLCFSKTEISFIWDTKPACPTESACVQAALHRRLESQQASTRTAQDARTTATRGCSTFQPIFHSRAEHNSTSQAASESNTRARGAVRWS